jgi:putative Holliday junction resolvase
MEGRIMALDFGLKRIGLAITDPLRIVARPLDTIENINPQNNSEVILKIASENNVTEIVFGMPMHTNGDEGDMAHAVREFADKLKTMTDIPIAFMDERFSSVFAAQIISEKRIKMDYKDRKYKALKDKFAAAIILQRYLDKKCYT